MKKYKVVVIIDVKQIKSVDVDADNIEIVNECIVLWKAGEIVGVYPARFTTVEKRS